MYDVSGKWEMNCIYSRFVAKQTERMKNEQDVKWASKVYLFNVWVLKIIPPKHDFVYKSSRMLSFRTL